MDLENFGYKNLLDFELNCQINWGLTIINFRKP